MGCIGFWLAKNQIRSTVYGKWVCVYALDKAVNGNEFKGEKNEEEEETTSA